MPPITFHAPGVTYNGLHTTTHPTTAQVGSDLAATKQHFGEVRTYYPQYGGGVVDVGKAAKDAGLNILLGLYLFEKNPDWIQGDYQRFVKPAVARGNVTAVVVGNEDPQMFDAIKEYLQKVKAELADVPVGTSQTSAFWLSDERAGSLLPLVDFIGVNIYPAWDWHHADASNQPVGVTPEGGFTSFRGTYERIQARYARQQIVVTETGWPTTFGPTSAQQFAGGISNARDYLHRVMAWSQAQRVVVYLHNMFDDEVGGDTSSPFNDHFGLIDAAGRAKGVLF